MQFVESTEHFLNWAFKGLIVASILIDILVWCRRECASWLLVFELLQIMCYGLVPYDYG